MRIRTKPGARWRLASALVLLAALASAAGCSNDNNADHADANDNGVKAQNYSDDGYLGITSSYPHVPGRHTMLDYATDARMMRDSIRGVRGVNGADITFHGAEAYVWLRLANGLAAREIPTAERQAATVLRFNFPRYTVYVRSRR